MERIHVLCFSIFVIKLALPIVVIVGVICCGGSFQSGNLSPNFIDDLPPLSDSGRICFLSFFKNRIGRYGLTKSFLGMKHFQ